jgi:hypothetical protein
MPHKSLCASFVSFVILVVGFAVGQQDGDNSNHRPNATCKPFERNTAHPASPARTRARADGQSLLRGGDDEQRLQGRGVFMKEQLVELERRGVEAGAEEVGKKERTGGEY